MHSIRQLEIFKNWQFFNKNFDVSSSKHKVSTSKQTVSTSKHNVSTLKHGVSILNRFHQSQPVRFKNKPSQNKSNPLKIGQTLSKQVKPSGSETPFGGTDEWDSGWDEISEKPVPSHPISWDGTIPRPIP